MSLAVWMVGRNLGVAGLTTVGVPLVMLGLGLRSGADAHIGPGGGEDFFPTVGLSALATGLVAFLVFFPAMLLADGVRFFGGSRGGALVAGAVGLAAAYLVLLGARGAVSKDLGMAMAVLEGGFLGYWGVCQAVDGVAFWVVGRMGWRPSTGSGSSLRGEGMGRWRR